MPSSRPSMTVLGGEAPAAFRTRQPTIWPTCRGKLRVIGEKVTLNLTSRARASAIGTNLECSNLSAIGTRGMLTSASAAVTPWAVLENLWIVVVLVSELRRRTAWNLRLANPSLKLCSLVGSHVEGVRCRLTTQAQRPGARDARIATTTLPPGSLQRMVRPRCHHANVPSWLSTSRQNYSVTGRSSVVVPQPST